MTTRVAFSDVSSSAPTSFASCWREQSSRGDKTAETQTDARLFRFAETETQSGLATEVVQDQVKSKHEGLTLLDHFCKLHPDRPREEWREGIARGKVTVDCDVVTNVDAPVSKDFFIEYVNVSSDKETQTTPLGPWTAPSSSSSSSSNSSRRRNQQRGDGKGGDDEGDDAYNDDDYEEYEGDEKQGESKGGEHGLLSSLSAPLRRLAKIMQKELEASSSSSAFQGYRLQDRGAAQQDDASTEAAAAYVQCLTVDLEKHRVLFPDWAKAKHSAGKVSRCVLSRNRERLYDVDFDDGARLQGVREEQVRLLGEPPLDARQGQGQGRSGAATSSQLREGVRVHARHVFKSTGRATGGGAGQGVTKYLPGRIVKAKAGGRFDVDCEGGAVSLQDVPQAEILVGGLSDGAVVECRRPAKQHLQATCVSWNATGSLLASSYGRTNVSGWCDAPGAVCVWSLFAKGFRPDNPDFVLDHSSCLLCVSFHPLQPSLVAAGSFSGEVVVWDLSSSSSSDSFAAPAVSPIAEHVHMEPVVGVSWVRDPAGEGFLLSSAGADGKVLFWTMQNRLAHPVLGFALSKGKTARKHYPPAHGATAFAFAGGQGSHARAPWVVCGQEGGAVVRGQLSRVLAQGPRVTADSFAAAQIKASSGEALFPPLRRADDAFAHDPHTGPVTGLSFSPFSRNLFLSCGGDGTVRLFHLLEPKVLGCWEPEPTSLSPREEEEAFSPVTAVSFSPTRPLVFAAAGGRGSLFLFDLAEDEGRPVAVLAVPPLSHAGDGAAAAAAATSNAGKAARRSNKGGAAGLPGLTSVAFNRKQRGLVAAADAAGRVHVWRLGWALTSGGSAKEAAALAKFESAAGEGEGRTGEGASPRA